jgi:endoglucanase
MMKNPDVEREKFLNLWRQISEHYQFFPKELFFELLNEPSYDLTADLWNDILMETVQVIRKSNPDRTLLVGAAKYGSLFEIDKLNIPKGENNIIVSFHFYRPFEFTHQGAEWIDGSNAWLGTTWLNKLFEREYITNSFNSLLDWSAIKNVPINLGEFGAYHKADINSRILWTSMIREIANKNGISWHYWEFCAGFGIYNQETETFNDGLLLALLPN